jgi:nitrogen fixation protein FixH
MIPSATSDKHGAAGSRPRGWRWPAFVVVLLLMNAGLAAVMIYYATTDKTFAVEPDYYRKAMNWDTYAAMHDASAKLGWSVHLRVRPAEDARGRPRLVLNVADRDGEPVSDVQFRGIAFHRARASERIALAFANAGNGEYECEAAMSRPGLWEVRLIASRGRDVFETIEQVEVVSQGAK